MKMVALYPKAQPWKRPKCPSAIELLHALLCANPREFYVAMKRPKYWYVGDWVWYKWLSQTRRQAKRRHKRMHTVWFSLQKVQKGVKLNSILKGVCINDKRFLKEMKTVGESQDGAYLWDREDMVMGWSTPGAPGCCQYSLSWPGRWWPELGIGVGLH